MKYKAVIFDLDGTLLDSLEDLANSMNNVLKSQGLPIHELEKYKYFVGNGMYNLVLRTIPPEKRDESLVKHCYTLMKKEYAKRLADNTKPYKGIDSLLNKLATLRYKTAVLSNKPHDMALLTIDKFLGRWKFDVVFGQRPGIPIKPDPAGALEIAELFQIPPKEFLYLGDTGTDMITAKAAGMHAVGCCGDLERLMNCWKMVLIH